MRVIVYSFAAGVMAQVAVHSWIWGRTGLLIGAALTSALNLGIAVRHYRQAVGSRCPVPAHVPRLPVGCGGCPVGEEPHAHVPLARGAGDAIVDSSDAELVAAYLWSAADRGANRYALGRLRGAPRGVPYVYMHRLILGAPKGYHVDHINHVGLDNRRRNLRLATASQNAAHQRPKTGGSSAYHGVHWWARRGVWRAYIRVEGHPIWLGSFDSEERAARVRDLAALDAWGEFATLNFPVDDHREGK